MEGLAAISGPKSVPVVPARYISDEEPAPAAPAEIARPTAAPAARIDGLVLLVEDNLLIALETEDSLQMLGATDVNIASTVAAALAFLRQARPHFAVLDYNLGRELSVRVAEQLEQDGVPFVFATGYYDTGTIGKRFRGWSIIAKQYTALSLLERSTRRWRWRERARGVATADRGRASAAGRDAGHRAAARA